MEGQEADERVDVQARDRLGMLVGDLLDVHAAHRGQHHERLLLAAVEDDRGVVLGGDVGRPLDPDLVHGETLDVHPEDRVGVGLGLVGVLRDLDAAGLAAAADLDLGLDHYREAQRLGRLARFLRRDGPVSLRHGYPVLREKLFSLVFEKIHDRRPD